MANPIPVYAAQGVLVGWTFNSIGSERNYDALRVESESFEIEKILHKKLNGGYVEDILGYRMKTKVTFAPLLGNKSALFDMYAFLAGHDRTIMGQEFTMRQVSLPTDSVVFEYLEKFKRGDYVAIEFIDKYLLPTGDTGSQMTLRLTDRFSEEQTVGTYYVNLVDEDTIGLVNHPLKFVGGYRDDVSIGYYHKLIVDFGFVPQSKLQWLRNFCLWGNKRIIVSTNGVDTTYGSVVLQDMEVKWDFLDGVNDAFATKLTFLESTPNFVVEIPPTPEFTPAPVIDETEADTKEIG
jgi:hypothetical protein